MNTDNYISVSKSTLIDSSTEEIIFFHGSPHWREILDNGLQGGDNTCGGTHGVFDHPIIFLAKSPDVAQKYGKVLTIRIPYNIFKTLNGEYIVDGLGDGCFTIDNQSLPPEWIALYKEERDYESETINFKNYF